MRPIAAIKIFDWKQTPKKYVKFTLYDGNVVTLKSDIGDVLQPKTGSNIWNPAYSGILDSSIASQATDIVIKKLATSIGSYAFYGSSSYAFSKLATVNDIGGTIQTIGTNAFRFCSSLTSVSFPNATSIGTYAFASCTSLTSASFPNVTSIGNWAFASCTSLTSASFPNVISIGNWAFQSCYTLQEANFPLISNAPLYAFRYCSSLTKAIIGGSKGMSGYAFNSCKSLSQIFIVGGSVGSLVSTALSYTPMSQSSYLGYFGSIYVRQSLLSTYQTKAVWSTFKDRIVGVEEEHKLLMKFSDATSSIITNIDDLTSSTMSAYKERLVEIQDLNLEMAISESIFALPYDSIGTFAFQSCTSLTTASFPKVTSIGTNAFRFCSSLTSVSFPNATSIGAYAFYYCKSLTSAQFPKVTSIGTSAFQSCTSLTTASFPKVTSIGAYAFQSCTSLTTASFPKVTSIKKGAFTSCNNLSQVYVRNSILHSIDNGYGNVNQIVVNSDETNLILAVGRISQVSNSTVTLIGEYAFYYCSSLTIVSFPNVTSIGECAFCYCPSLITASFPKVTSIGTSAFQSCTSLTTASFPKVTSIGSWAFWTCTRLNNIYFTGSSIPSLANSNAFSNVATNCRIYVAESLYDQYLVAANWSLVKSKITPYIV